MNYRSLFDTYGETPELVSEYVRELIRGSVEFDQYNSEAVAKAYLMGRYGVDESLLEKETWSLNDKGIEDVRWMIGLRSDLLSSIYMSCNKIRSLDGIDECELPNLIYLYLSADGIETLGKMKFPKLEFLLLNENEITSLRSFDACYLPRLWRLDLINNQINTLEGIDSLKLPSLIYLNLYLNPCIITQEDRENYTFVYG